MTLGEILDCWESALRRAEYAIDHAYSRESLERYFFLMRCTALRAPSARVHSLGAAAFLSVRFRYFTPWTLPALEAWARKHGEPGWAHADPPGGDGALLHWIAAMVMPRERKEVYIRVKALFGSDQLLTILRQEAREMPKQEDEQAWYDEGSSGSYWKPPAGRNKVTITDEPAYRENQFGRRNLDIPTNLGIFSTTQRTIVSALSDYAKRHKGKVKGATLIFTSNGAAGTAVRYEKVEVR